MREVRQFGAKGDGTGDDTEAVKKAIASLPQYGGVLYFPPGTAAPPPFRKASLLTAGQLLNLSVAAEHQQSMRLPDVHGTV